MRFLYFIFFILYVKAFNINNIIYRANLCKNINNNYLVIHNNKTIDICFRGTKNMNDILLNFNIIPHNFLKQNIMVHKGFLYKYLSFRNIIINKIKDIISNNNIEEIYISGHSSGGAIANIASLDLFYIYPNIKINTITFGAPKLANKGFNDEYNKNIINSLRIVNKNDLIQYLPLPILYKHIHKPYILNDKNKNNSLFKKIIENHSINTYINNLN